MKKFTLSSDLIHTVSLLDDKSKGELFLAILKHVNDINVDNIPIDVKIALEPIKQDLIRQKEIKSKRSIAGSTSATNKQVKTINKQGLVTKDESVSNFLQWFNRKRKELTKKESRLKELTETDKRNLHKLRKSYNKEDFEIAFLGLSKSQWAKDNNGYNANHFLRNDNFNRYYIAGQDLKQKEVKDVVQHWNNET